ncbi:MAG: immunity 70 family protein [Lachnospiraceae bacterium]|jgi:hypothetical protein|nr:immunity 70 family protein [Lachnospiraceae bacterium]
MAVGFSVSFNWYMVGNGAFLNSFFSTVTYNLEEGKRGSRFPVLMLELYQGEIEYAHLHRAVEELNEIVVLLQNFSPLKVIWDIEDLSKQPPWGNNISKEITDLSNYFVTSDGKDLINVLRSALEKAIALKTSLKIESL